MRIFVIGTGRCGTFTFFEACKHITNYTSGHETLTHGKVVYNGLDYPDNHIEIDARLSYSLPILIHKYPNSFFVHLQRKMIDCVNSLSKRNEYIHYAQLHFGDSDKWHTVKKEVLEWYYFNTNEIIQSLLNDQNSIHIWLHNVKNDFKEFWDKIKAEGDFKKALSEFDIKYNKS